MTSPQTFGIDLGTTCSAIGLVREGTPLLVEIEGEVLMPSVVSYRQGEAPLVGRQALNRLAAEPEATLRAVKRLMGTGQRWEIGGQQVSPPEVSALILARLCDAAEEQLAVRPERVVITVPAWFTQAQRTDTRRAGEIAGLEVARIINEPTAAALAHAHRSERKRRSLVYDFGGGTFDVSLVDQTGDVVEVRASHGDTHLGGMDLDRALTRRILERLAQEDPGLAAAVEESRAAQLRLQAALEEAKIELSSSVVTRLRVPFLLECAGEPRHLELEIQRREVEEELAPLLERTFASVDQVLADAGLASRQIDDLLLVGGSTRIPAVWDGLFARYGIEGNAAIAPDSAVALGAAIQAAIVDGSRVDGILVDVAPYSLSIAALSGVEFDAPTLLTCQVLTPRNSPLPSRHSHTFETSHPEQSELHVTVFQGSDPNPLRNSILGKIEFQHLPPAPDGESGRPISVEFRHDLDGMVQIRVTDDLSEHWIDGKLSVDGDEMKELRDDLIAEIACHELIPGDGRDTDPFGPLAEAAASVDVSWKAMDDSVRDLEDRRGVAELAAEVEEEVELDEAVGTFRAVLKGAAELEANHADDAAALLALARSGLEVAEAAGSDGAERARLFARYEELADALFELGIYL